MLTARAFAADLWYCNAASPPRNGRFAARPADLRESLWNPPAISVKSARAGPAARGRARWLHAKQSAVSYGISWALHMALFAYLGSISDEPPALKAVEQGVAAVPLSAITTAPDAAQPIDAEQPVDFKLYVPVASDHAIPPPIHPVDVSLQRPAESLQAAPHLPEQIELAPQSEIRIATPLRREVTQEVSRAPPQPSAPLRETRTAAVDPSLLKPEVEVLATAAQSASSAASFGAADELPRKRATNAAPAYPAAARAAGQQGTVILLVRLAASGSVESVSVTASSGFQLLDDSALQTVRRWRFDPARRGGRPIPFDVEVPIRFSLRAR
jgi:protein TonB